MSPARCEAVLIHGLGASSATWDELRQECAGWLSMTAPDLPWGNNGHRHWAEDDAYVGAVSRALRAGPSVVIAHSFGAGVVLDLLASQRDPQPAALIVIAPFYRADYGSFDWPTLAYYLNDFPAILRAGITAHARRAVDQDLLADMALRVQQRIGPHGWLRFISTYLASPGLDLRALTCPTLVVTGGCDIAAFPADGATLANRLPLGDHVHLPDSGHFPMSSHTSLLAEAIGGFLSRTTALAAHDLSSRTHQPIPEGTTR